MSRQHVKVNPSMHMFVLCTNNKVENRFSDIHIRNATKRALFECFYLPLKENNYSEFFICCSICVSITTEKIISLYPASHMAILPFDFEQIFQFFVFQTPLSLQPVHRKALYHFSMITRTWVLNI